MSGEESVDDMSLVEEECVFLESSCFANLQKTNFSNPSMQQRKTAKKIPAKVRIFDKDVKTVCKIEGGKPQQISDTRGSGSHLRIRRSMDRGVSVRPCVGNNACGSSTEE